jgi:hypothetical protein
VVRPRRRRRNNDGKQPTLRGHRRIPSNHKVANEDLDQRARNAEQAARGGRLRGKETRARGRGIQRGRGRGIQRGRGRDVGRREGGNKVQEVPGSAYIQFQA